MAGKVIHRDRNGTNEMERELISLYSRYYRILLSKGLLISLAITASLLLLLVLLNESFDPSTKFREIAFYCFLGISIITFFTFVISPLITTLRRNGSAKLLFTEKLIREKYPEIEDGLLNLIELGKMLKTREQEDLILASIKERRERLSVFSFQLAIQLRKLILPAVLIVLVGIIYGSAQVSIPDVMNSGYRKTFRYNEVIGEKDKLDLILLNDSLLVGMGNNLRLDVQAVNNHNSSAVFLRIGESRFPMKPVDNHYTYLLESVNGDIQFKLEAGDFESDFYDVQVIPLPEILSYTIEVFPPEYTGLSVQKSNEAGDISIAEGSAVRWSLRTDNTDFLLFTFNEDSVIFAGNENRVDFRRVFTESLQYSLIVGSSRINEAIEQQYFIEVIDDEYPAIEVNQVRDSVSGDQVFFQSNIEDDYGFSKLEFIVIDEIIGDTLYRDNISIREDVLFQRFYYAVNFDEIIEEGRQIIYHFSVWDNDEVNGHKMTKSASFRMQHLSAEARFEQNRKKGEDLEKSISDGKEVIDELKEKVGELMNSQLIDNEEDWEISNKVDEITDMKDMLEEMISNIKEENKELNIRDSDSNERMPQILEKQKQIEELFEKLMDEELEKLFEEFEKLAGEMTKKERIEKTEELKMNLENLEEQLDVNLELLKKLEQEKEILDIADKLSELAEELENNEKSAKEAQDKFDKLSERYSEELERNQELNKPNELKDLKKEKEEIRKDLDEAEESEEGDKEARENATEKKKEAAKKMKSMSEEMEKQIGAGSGGSSIDLELMRQLARQLNDYSFKQEDLLKYIENHNSRSKRFQETGIEQRKLEMKFGVIADSLRSLGYQEAMIAAILNEEVFHVETSLLNLKRSVQEGNISQLRYEQQKVMEGCNELAVRLDEIIDNVQRSQGEGEGKSNFTDSKPKDGKEEVGEMRQKQNSLKEQMKEMIEMLKKGMKEGKGGEQMVKMLSEREQFRKSLEDLRNSGKIGEDAKKKIQDAERMLEEVEKDIIYNKVNDVTIQKEEWIQTRLLEAEEAENDREKENVRESEEFKGVISPADLPDWKELEKLKLEQGRSMNHSDIKLKDYYRKKYQEYLKRLNKKNHGNRVPLY